jgi:crotonobetainyl-CoA:carnitine CoA-transferase CaiB-like acyl-CoA transferase
MSGAGQPLRDLRVLDLSRVLAGPYCAQLLADQGADVIKVEAPGGDENRLWGARAANGVTCNFNSVNRGKRSVRLDLKQEAAQAVLRGLIARADVVIHSFLPETGARLGVDYERVKALRPEVVFCSISGYGEKGPMRGNAGYDLMMQAFSGIMSTTGYEGGPPVRVGASCIDLTTGFVAYGGIMTALFNRMRGAGGDWVRVSLLETAVSLLGYHAVAWLQAGLLPTREGSGVLHLVPYQAFKCRDGTLLAGATNDAAWRRFVAALGREELADDERFRTNDRRLENRGVLVDMLQAEFETRPVGHWVPRFEAKGVAVAPLHTLDQVLTHPQVLANDLVVEAVDGTGARTRVLGAAFKLQQSGGVSTRAAPLLGADTEQVLRDDLGYDAEGIERLRQCRAI